MSKEIRLNKELDILTKVLIFFMTVTVVIFIYAYIKVDVLGLLIAVIPASIGWYVRKLIGKGLKELEDE